MRICSSCWSAWLLGTLLGLSVLGCGASSERARTVSEAQRGSWKEAWAAYERSHDPAELVPVAEGILAHAALSSDATERAAGFSELGAAGRGARPLLVQLASTQSASATTRALALRALMQLGDDDAREQLRALADHSDTAVVDLAHAALDPKRDRAHLLAALQGPRAERRLAALSVLAPHADASLQPVLADAARRDPLPAIRAAALGALARFGSIAADAISAGLGDGEQSVRLAAIAALVRATGADALPRVSRYLDGMPSPESVETARALLGADILGEVTRSRQALAAALDAKDFPLRARAALIQQTLSAQHRDPRVLKAALARETVTEVRLALSLALGAADPDAHAALQALQTMPVVVGVQAAAVLARLGEPAALAALEAKLSSPSPAVRRSVARTLGAELGHAEKMPGLLRDPEASVSRAAASAVLHASADSP